MTNVSADAVIERAEKLLAKQPAKAGTATRQTGSR
jgi:hypothetical protein